jgi:hypothetical protein
VASEPAVSSKAWRIANGVMLLLFVFAAVVQVNDPDPFKWIALYLLAAVACTLDLRGRHNTWFSVAVALMATGWALLIAPRVIGSVPFREMFGAWEMKDTGIEESREMYGLSLVALWMALQVGYAKRPR